MLLNPSCYITTTKIKTHKYDGNTDTILSHQRIVLDERPANQKVCPSLPLWFYFLSFISVLRLWLNWSKYATGMILIILFRRYSDYLRADFIAYIVFCIQVVNLFNHTFSLKRVLRVLQYCKRSRCLNVPMLPFTNDDSFFFDDINGIRDGLGFITQNTWVIFAPPGYYLDIFNECWSAIHDDDNRSYHE